MFTLYGRKASGSAAVEALLAVLKASHSLEEVSKTEDGLCPAWFLSLNPRGLVPVLKLPDDSVMTESAAMMIHLADCFPEAGLAPPVGTAARAQYLRWMIYAATTLYMTDLRLYYPDRYSADISHADAVKAKAILDLNAEFDVLTAALGDEPFILGEKMSAADIYAAMIISWSEDVQALLNRQHKLRRLYDAVSANPVIRAVWDRHDMP
jgi:glutathione S-transferase